MAALPSLIAEPTRYPGCCISLSQPLLASIQTLLQLISSTSSRQERKSGTEYDSVPQPEPALLLSIGSGSGLLEELLHNYLTRHALTRNWSVEGVEVNRAVNVHLPEDRINQVAGTWAVLESRARDAAALMFVYPRDGALVRRYIDAFMISSPGTRHSGSRVRDEQSMESKYESNSGRKGEEAKREDESVNDRGENSNRGRAQLVLWLGPKCDWEDTGFASSDGRGEFEVLEMRDGVGLAEYEMLAVLRRKTALPS